MSSAVIGLALLAALLHATWNALLRSRADRLWSITVMSFATTAAAVPLVLVLPFPLKGSWPYLGVSAVLQVAYSILLAYAYQYGELSEVYPLVRGSVPLLVSLGGFLLVGQRLGRTSLGGIALVSLGVLSLTWNRVGAGRRPAVLALATAVFVASYVTADGIGVRQSGNAQSYTAWIFLLYGALMPLTYRLLRGTVRMDLCGVETWKALGGGALSLLSYGAIIAALALGKLGPVSALRETSVVFSALIGRVALGEVVTGRRLLACVAITFGAICIGYDP